MLAIYCFESARELKNDENATTMIDYLFDKDYYMKH